MQKWAKFWPEKTHLGKTSGMLFIIIFLNRFGNTPLHNAANYGNLACIEVYVTSIEAWQGERSERVGSDGRGWRKENEEERRKN
jgi:hypothetical protein